MIETRTQANAITRQKIRDAKDRIRVLASELAATEDVDEIRELGQSIFTWQAERDRLEAKLTRDGIDAQGNDTAIPTGDRFDPPQAETYDQAVTSARTKLAKIHYEG